MTDEPTAADYRALAAEQDDRLADAIAQRLRPQERPATIQHNPRGGFTATTHTRSDELDAALQAEVKRARSKGTKNIQDYLNRSNA